MKADKLYISLFAINLLASVYENPCNVASINVQLTNKYTNQYLRTNTNSNAYISEQIRNEIQRFESVHPCIYTNH
uniref:Uncharacterized protein n=1 Tax=Parascaris equorum TaxID=6256 RepID=A0A914S772_PAREQ